MWLLLSLLACRPDRQVVWDAQGADDRSADAVTAAFTPAGAESDRELLDVLHATGSWLHMTVYSRAGVDVAGWSVETLRPLTCEVVIDDVEASGTAMPVTLLFKEQGATELFVRDPKGEIIDWQPIEVRDPVDAAMYAWEALAVGVNEPLAQLDTLPGGRATIGVSWLSSTGDALAGSGLLVASDLADPVGARVSDVLASSGLEAVTLVVGDDAAVGSQELTLSAGETAVRTTSVVIHDPAEVSAITLDDNISERESDDTAGSVLTSGSVRARVAAGETELVGVEVAWSVDGVVFGRGTAVWIEGAGSDDLHELQACYGEVCATSTVAGVIVDTVDSTAPPPSSVACGCATEGGSGGLAGWVAGIAGLGIVARRRRR